MPIPSGFAQRLDPILQALVKAFPTPFHIYDEVGVLAAHHSLERAFAGWPHRQHFAVKALPNPAILRLLQDAGSGFDCSSPVELKMAHDVGARADDMVFTSNNTTDSEYQQALDMGARITFDDVHYLMRAAKLPDVVTFRIAPHGQAATSSLMGHSGQSKFGVPPDRIIDAYRVAIGRGARRFGLYGMNASNELDWRVAAGGAGELIAHGKRIESELGIAFEYINFGGGLGIPYRPEETPFDVDRFAADVCTRLASAFPDRQMPVLTECGRYVSGPNGVLITRVLNRVDKGRLVVGLDASMSALIRPAFYPGKAYHHADLPLAGARIRAVVDLVGSMCENTDRFATEREMADPREGDIVRLHDTGAHGHSMGMNYNGRLRPAELLLHENGQISVIRRAETEADYRAMFCEQAVALAMGSVAMPEGAA